jgi:hypothetical protein
MRHLASSTSSQRHWFDDPRQATPACIATGFQHLLAASCVRLLVCASTRFHTTRLALLDSPGARATDGMDTHAHTHTHTHTHTTVRDNCLGLRHTTRVSLRPGRSCDTSLPQQYSPHWRLNPGPSVYRTDALPLSYRGTGTIDTGTMTEMLHYRRIFTSRRRRPCSSRAVSNRGNHTSSATWAACCGRLRRP